MKGSSKKMVKPKGGFDKSSKKGKTHKEGEDNRSSKKKGDIPEVLGKEFWFRAPYLGGVDKFWHVAREFRVTGKGPPNLFLGAPEVVVSGDEVDPIAVYRFGIEKGEYPFSTVQCKFQSVRIYETWTGEILGDPGFHELLKTAQVYIAIASSLRTNVSRDKSWVDVMISRWCSVTHTFLATWGEFTPTLEDVCHLMRLNAMGEVNPSLDLTAKQQEILEALQNSKDLFTTIKSGYQEGVYVPPSWRDKKHAKNSFSGWILYWYRDFGPVRKDDLRDEVPGIGFKKVGYLAAFLTLWLSLHVFLSPPEGGIDPGLFKIATILSTGRSVPLAPLFLRTLYRRLDLIAPAARLSKG
ncbi:hypothetical protein Vadar_018865 [Vaccinium darrowii]|uniref:Uncharacterized protein n=1 Tax=Vaccinium darrowii TaxID=229202 RepID=A0ACB7YFQ3_9ERIC|nr:hypothetical protein Vadar_018865 [Vaccinium darrowii]